MLRNLCLIILLLTIGICLLGCGEGEPIQDISAIQIQAITSVSGVLYLADYVNGVFRFNNSTQSWENIFNDVQEVYTLGADETTLYLDCASGIYRLEPDGETFTKIMNRGGPLFVVDGESFYASLFGQLVTAKKVGGSEWVKLNTGWDDEQELRSLAVTGNTIFILTKSQGVYRSVNSGETWTAINQGLPDIPFTFYDLPLLFSQNTVYIGTTIGVYHRPKGVTTWFPAGLDDYVVYSLVESETALYAEAWRNGVDTVFRSDDGGQNWQNIGIEGGVSILCLAVFNNRLYVGTFGEGVYYTDDEGQTWHPLNKGLNLSSDE